MPRSRPSQPRYLEFSGAPSFEPESANLSLYGFETSAGLDGLTLSSPTALGHTTFDSYQQLSAYPASALGHEQPYFANYTNGQDPGNTLGAQTHNVEGYWQAQDAVTNGRTPLPSPPLLSANSLNLPPLFSTRHDHNQHVLLSQNVPYGYPAPPDIPYAESAASAASSNLSPPEDEGGYKGPMDEEKRRRNLAASARFRQKKKLREQQLEQQTKELNDKATELEDRIDGLQKENDFLKALLTEKETDMTPEGKRKFHDFALLVEHGEY